VEPCYDADHLHEWVIDGYNKDITGILELWMIDITGDMGIGA
jgi:hypothetical protein